MGRICASCSAPMEEKKDREELAAEKPEREPEKREGPPPGAIRPALEDVCCGSGCVGCPF